MLTDLERERPYLFRLAYRLLGSAADADDVLQEAFLRARDLEGVQSPRAMLTTIVTRLCLDEVRSARRRREEYVGPWLPEPITTDEPAPDDQVETAQSLSLAFLVVLDSLSPLERAVFVLREVLDLDFAEIAEAVGRSEAACRQLLHRAREHVAARRSGRRPSAAAQRGLAGSLLQALIAGDLERLTELLTADVAAVSDHGGKAKANLRNIVGADRVARFLLGMYGKIQRRDWRSAALWLNDSPALVAFEGGVLVAVTVFEMVDDGHGPRIAAIDSVRNPDKLARLGRIVAAGEGRALVP